MGSPTKIDAMASGDDKPRGRGSGDEDRPSGKRSRGSGSGLTNRSDPFDEEPAAGPAEEEPAAGLTEEEPAATEPEAPRRQRFSFRRRSREVDDTAGSRAASLVEDGPQDDDLADLPEPPRFRRPPWWVLVGGLVLLLIVSSALYGEFNTERYFLVCSGSRVEAHRGRGFPWPFGHQPMLGSQYRPVALGGDAQCQTQEVDSEAELRHALLKLGGW
jgi:hypothetical protein